MLLVGALTVSAQEAFVCQYDGMNETNRVAVKSVKVSGVNRTLTWTADRDCPQCGVGFSFTATGWSTNNYVFAPAAIYDGNRFDISYRSWPPYILDWNVKNWPNRPVVTTNIHHLNKDGSDARIDFLAGETSAPMVGYWDSVKQEGHLYLADPTTPLGETGFSVRESPKNGTCTFVLSAPGVRTTKYTMCHSRRADCGDRAPDVKKGTTVTFGVSVIDFKAKNVDEFLARAFDVRKLRTGRTVHAEVEDPETVIRQILANEDAVHWFEDKAKGMGYYCSGPRYNNLFYHVQLGWGGVPVYLLPILERPTPERLRRCSLTWDTISKMNGKSGLYYANCMRGEMYGDAFGHHTDLRDHAMIRRTAITIYYGIQSLEKMAQLGVATKPEWRESVRRACDGVVALWKRYGRLCQHVKVDSGEIHSPNSTNGALIPGALALASRYFSNPAYLETAKSTARYLYEHDLAKGYCGGGPSEILQAPDSESSCELGESYVALWELTGEREWVEKAKAAAAMYASWVEAFDYPFPKTSRMGQLGIKATGSVWASVQNRHSAPGPYVMSADWLVKLSKATGDSRYAQVFYDNALNIAQYATTEKHRFMPKGDPGTLTERVNTGDWEGRHGIGSVIARDSNQHWENVALLTLLALQKNTLYRPRAIDAKWCSLGTSITWYDSNVYNARGKFSRGYQDRVRDVLRFREFVNCGVNGGTVRHQLGAVPKADYYTVEHGINDWGQKVKPGTFADYENDARNNTFYANYRILVDKIRAANPAAKVILCTPRKAYGFGTYLPAKESLPKDGVYLREYAEAVRAIAKREGFAVADFYANCGEEPELADLSIDVALHPNDEGYQRMADELIRAFDEAQALDKAAASQAPSFGKLKAVWTAKENKGAQVNSTLPTAALLGNGDLGLVNGDLRRGQGVVGKRFQLTSAGMYSCGRLDRRRDFSKRDVQQVSFGAMELDFGRECAWDDALLTEFGDLVSKSGSAELRTFVAATENLIVTEVKGIALPKVTYSFPDDPDFPHESGEGWGLRKTYNGVPGDPRSWQHVGKAVTKAIGRYLVTAFAIDAEPVFKVATEADVAAVRARHERWWRDWWGRSRVKIPDPDLQRYYEGSLYLLGAGTRPDKPCGLYASWVTTDRPGWHNDFHLNYNYVSPFYGCYAANRPEIAASMVEPHLAALPIGLRVAKKSLPLLNRSYVASRADLADGIDDAVLLPVGILPRGFTSEGEASLWNQTMNAAFSAASFCTYYEYTLDDAYLARAYPFLEKTANFYVKWCERETLPDGGYRYSFYDSYGEAQGWGKNCSPTLGCVKHLFATLAAVEKDAAKRKVWTDYRDHLAELPQAVYVAKDFKRKILSLCETEDCRFMVRGTGAVELEAVIPGEAFAFDITDEYRALATNTVDAMVAKTGVGMTWGNDNQTPKLFATAIRAGYPCRAVIDAFKRHQLAPKWQRNFTVHDGYHGIEKAGGIEFVNSMLLQCDHGFVKVFPNWTGEDALFENLRAKGAFLVSSAMKGGRVTHVTVTSLKGGVFRLVSPWKDYPTQGTTRRSKEPVIELRLAPGQTTTLDPGHREELRAVARELRSDLVRVAARTKKVFGKDVKITMPSAGTYYGLWPDDWLFPNKLAPELLSDAEAKALFRFLTENIEGLPQLPDRIEPSGHCVFQPGPEGRPHGRLMPAHLPAAWIRVVKYLFDRTGDAALKERWRGVIARSVDQLRFRDGLPFLADTELQVGFGFFDTVALKGQDLMCSVVLHKAFVDAEPLFGGELGKKCRALADGIRANIARLRASEGGFLSDSIGCRQFSPWSNGFLYSSGLVDDADRRAIRERIWSVREKVVKYGMVRHAPEPWRQMNPIWTGGEGTYMNGGFWSVGTAYAFAALYERDPAYAAALAREMLENLRRTDFAEWIGANRSNQGAHGFLMGIALPLAAIEAVLENRDLIACF